MSFNRREFLASSAGLSALASADALLAQALKQTAAPKPDGHAYGPFHDLRSYMAELERRGLVLRIPRIDQDRYEATALFYRLVDRFGMYEAPTVVMEQVRIDGRWIDGPLITNHFGHWDTECIPFGVEPVAGDGRATYRRALDRMSALLAGGAYPTAPYLEVAREAAACKEIVLRGDAIDLTKFAFIQSNPGDAGRYVNTGSVYTEDPELGKNFGTYRCQLKGPRLLGVNPEPGQGAYRMFMKQRERGEKVAKVSIALGQDPIMWVVSSSKLARGPVDELELVSGLRGQPLRVVKSETNQHLVPATSEMVIEGEVPLDQELPEGPFGEMYGYMGKAKAENFYMNVTCVTHRPRPWILNMFTGAGRGFPTAPLEQLAMTGFRRFVPNLVLMHSPVESTGLTFVSIRKQKAGEGLEVGKRVAEVVSIAKVVVIVDEDVDVLDRVAVMHAVGARWQPASATTVIDSARGMPLDPSITQSPMTSKIVIDATRQWPEEGGPAQYQALNRTMLEEQAPEAFSLIDANWRQLVGKWRPPGA